MLLSGGIHQPERWTLLVSFSCSLIVGLQSVLIIYFKIDQMSQTFEVYKG